jgi:hypothetical protein
MWIELDKSDPLTLRKEVLYEGEDFVKRYPGGGVRFDVTEARLEQLARQVVTFKEAGYDIPIARSHAGWDRAHNRLGSVVSARVLDNSASKPALFLDFRFDSLQARDVAIEQDVSVGIDSERIAVGGKVWDRPLLHVASTNVPVIQGLDPWESTQEDNMDFAPILAELNLSSADEILDAIKGLKAKAEKAVEDLPKIELSADPTLVKMHVDARKVLLDGKVAQGKMSPAARAKVESIFGVEKRVGLELSNGEGSDLFYQVIDAVEVASQVKPLADSGRVVELSHDADKAETPTDKFLASRRAAKAEFDKKQGR